MRAQDAKRKLGRLWRGAKEAVAKRAKRVARAWADAGNGGVAAPFHRGKEAEPLFGSDYWSGRAQPPAWKLSFGVVLAPIATLGPTLFFALLVYWFSENDHAAAWSMTIDAGIDFFSALYLPLFLGSAIGGGMLWALRLRSKRAFVLVGGALGAVAGGALYLAHGALPSVVAVYALGSGALSLLALRWIAGVKKLG